MQFYYGGYYHAANSVFIKSSQRVFVRGMNQRTHLARTSWNLEGKLLGSSVTNIQFQLALLQNAYAFDGGNAGFVDNNNNGAPTQWQVNSGNTIGGVRVTNPISHENVKGADGVTYLKYTFGLTWDVMWAGPTDTLSFQESLSFHDNQGQGMTIERLPQNGPPIIQQITYGSFFYMTQSGTLTQAGPNPQTPAPLFPGNFRGQDGSRSITILPIKTIKGIPYEYGITWKFDFVATQPFDGSEPNYG